MNSKQEKTQEIYTKTNYNETVKPKDKEGILKEAREKQFIMYKGSSIRLMADSYQNKSGQKAMVSKGFKGKNPINQEFYNH